MLASKLKDWQGNEIKAGDTVVRIMTSPLIDPNSWFYMTPDGDSIPMFDDKKIDISKWWEVCNEYKISEFDRHLLATLTTNEFTVTSLASFCIYEPNENSIIIFAIKGISDDKELFYAKD